MKLLLVQVFYVFGNTYTPSFSYPLSSEFTLAEIEHFVNPEDKRHPKFKTVSHLVLNLFPREDQLTTKKTVEMTVGDAVKNVHPSLSFLTFFRELLPMKHLDIL